MKPFFFFAWLSIVINNFLSFFIKLPFAAAAAYIRGGGGGGDHSAKQ